MHREADISISIVGAMKCPATCLPSDLRSGTLDLTDLTDPLPEPPGDSDDPDGWSALCDEVAEDREAYEQGLRLSLEQASPAHRGSP